MGLIQAFDYPVSKPNAAQVTLQHVAATRWGAWFFSRTLHSVDQVLLRLSQGRVTVPGLATGLPIVTVSTTGARSGQRRTSPLVGVPAGDDLAVIGTSFGQARTPGWYYNMRTTPEVEVSYRNQTLKAVAREASDTERQAIWARARTIYLGYEAYARRITHRDIHVMVLNAAPPDASAR
jgi:deazaflavin-dependent oxidoreductase (nitroreductase family)